MSPLILTLKLNSAAFQILDDLRQQHFPRERSFLPAHVTMFHALPGDQEAAIVQTLERVCSQTPVLPLHFPKLRFLGRGIAVELDCSALIDLRKQLATGWADWLTQQDQQGYRPHVTIQNKVDSIEARQLYTVLDRTWKPFDGYGEGVLLWRYQGGPWNFVQEFPFERDLNR